MAELGIAPRPGTEYEDDGTGRIRVGTDYSLIPKANGESGLERNCSGRVFVLDGDEVEVWVKIAGKDHTRIVRFTAAAKSGKMSSVFVRVRAEADVNVPVGPEPEPER